jgi:hypothetical protein
MPMSGRAAYRLYMRARELRRLASLAVVMSAIVACGTGCSSDSRDTADDAVPTLHPTTSVPAGCINATDQAHVSKGPLTMGPFIGIALAITSTHEEKVWLGTRRKNVEGPASLTVIGPDGSTRDYTRPAATAAPYQSFYPGTVAVTGPGTWTVVAHVGPDTLCARARYR